MIVPPEFAEVLRPFLFYFSSPTYNRFVLLAVGAVLTTGRRTVANVVRTLGPFAPGDLSDYQRVLNRAPWPILKLGCCLARSVLARFPPDGPVVLVGDDTVEGHKGPKVYGKARHRDPVRSTRSYTAFKYGHRWVVLAVLVKVPGATRPWALPVLADLYRSEQDNRARGRPHRTPAQLMARLLRLILIRLPGRGFVFVGDAGYGTHEFARFCHRHRRRLTLVSKLHPDANLHEPPSPYSGTGRPRVKGAALPKPRETAAGSRLTARTVGWYGGGIRRVGVAGGTGHWHKSGKGLVPLRWVYVRDLEGTHREEFFFTTDPALSAAGIIAHYTGRWNLETTFQESRAHLGLSTTRGRSERTVLRAAPCLLCLYSVVALAHAALPGTAGGASVSWRGKAGLSFSDALCRVRRHLWCEGVLGHPDPGGGVLKLPADLREVLLTTLAPAA